MRMFSLLYVVNHLTHNLNENGLSQVWINKCALRLSYSVNELSHTLHENGLDPL